MEGIDLSHWNTPVTWSTLNPSPAFVIVKATDGASADPQYATTLAACRGLGLQAIGHYHFFEPHDPPAAQLQNIINTVSLVSGDLPVAIDVENQYSKGVLSYAMSPADAPNVAALVAGLYAHYGVYPLIYTSAVVWNAMGNPNTVNGISFANCPLWIAHYTSAPAPNIPAPWTTWRIWQYSQTGAVNGVTGSTDLNRTSDALLDIRVP